MKDSLFKDVISTIMTTLDYLCVKYQIPYDDTVKFGNTSELIEFTLYHGFLENEDAFRSNLPLMCNIDDPSFSLTKKGDSMPQFLFFVKIDSLLYFIACNRVGIDKLKEFFISNTRIDFSKLYMAKYMFYDREFAHRTADDFEKDIQRLNEYAIDESAYNNEESARLTYDNCDAFKASLDLLKISREEYIRWGKLKDEILRDWAKSIGI